MTFPRTVSCWLLQVLPYVVCVIITCVFVVWGQRLDQVDWRAPFSYTGDTLLILPLVKSFIETGTQWHNDRLGAPGIQEIYDFPVIDNFHFAMIWLLSFVDNDPTLIFNIYHILTYPLTTITAMIVARQLGMSTLASGATAILYTFLPYHYIRAEAHYFLAAYYIVPLTILVTIWIASGPTPFIRRNETGKQRLSLWNGQALAVMLIAILTATAGAYYAFFGCALLAMATCYQFVIQRSVLAVASSLSVILMIATVGVIQHIPAMRHQLANGNNSAPHLRISEEAEIYGLKMSQLILPTENHRNIYMNRIQSAVSTSLDRPVNNSDNRAAALGMVGSVGFLTLLVLAILPIQKNPLLSSVSALTLFAFLLGTVGGYSAIFAHLISPQVRAYARIVVYLAFLSLFVVMWGLDRVLTIPKLQRYRLVNNIIRLAIFASVVGVGIWDQTNRFWFRRVIIQHRVPSAISYNQDVAYFRLVEEKLPGGCVFMLPMIPYPESKVVEQLAMYEHVRGYIHTKTLRWSFGAMRGREVDLWQREVATLPVKDMLDKLVIRGFDGLFIDRRGYKPAEADKLIADVVLVLGNDITPLIHPDNVEYFYDLRPYATRLRTQLGPKFDELKQQDIESVKVLWLDGFQSFEPLGKESLHRWSQSRSEAIIINPSTRNRTFHLSMVFRTDSSLPSPLRIRGSVWQQDLEISAISDRVDTTITVPPGRHSVRFECDPSTDWLPDHSRRHLFFVAQFTMTEQVVTTP